MRVLLLPVAALVVGAPAGQPARPDPAANMPVLNPQVQIGRCPETPMSLARKMGENPKAQTLDQLPDAMMFAAVDRRIDGCPAPLVLSGQPARR